MERVTAMMAWQLAEQALQAAEDIQSPSSVAVVDSGRNLVAFVRMDQAPLASIEISMGKAYTARSLNMPTADLDAVVQPGQPLYGLAIAHRIPLVTFGGGLPIELNGEIVGGIGVAGGTPEQDAGVAHAALAEWRKSFEGGI